MDKQFSDVINVIVKFELFELFLKTIQSYYRYNVIYIGEQHNPDIFKNDVPEDTTYVRLLFNIIPIELDENLLWGISFKPDCQYFKTELYPELNYQHLTEKEFIDSLQKYSKPTIQEYYNRKNGNYLTNLDELKKL